MRLPTGQPNIFDRAWRWVFKFDVKAVRFLQSRRWLHLSSTAFSTGMTNSENVIWRYLLYQWILSLKYQSFLESTNTFSLNLTESQHKWKTNFLSYVVLVFIPCIQSTLELKFSLLVKQCSMLFQKSAKDVRKGICTVTITSAVYYTIKSSDVWGHCCV